jgi:glycine oxidase
MSENSVDYIIVGQGLAGSCLAYQLIKRGKKVAVLDTADANRCTTVAAGLFNPVTGQNLIKTWLADETFGYLRNFYLEIEAVLSVKFYYEMPLYRPFSTIEEQNEWMGRSAQREFQSVLQAVLTQPRHPDLRDAFGGILLKQTGFIDTNTLMAAVRKLILEKAVYKNESFDHSLLSTVSDGVITNGIHGRRIIFCEGSQVIQNPWFSKVPVKPLKGETLQIKTEFNEQVILNRGVYMVPGKSAGHWRVGSTYNLQDKTLGNTEKGIAELTSKLDQLLRVPFEIQSSDWGIRPTTVDRRPLLGCHPQNPRVVIFNGLGTKGVSLAPYFSDVLVQWLENGVPIAKEVDVTRFKVLS